MTPSTAGFTKGSWTDADMYEALSAAAGYLLNAKIDLETGAPKRTAIQTIEGGLKLVRAALDKAALAKVSP